MTTFNKMSAASPAVEMNVRRIINILFLLLYACSAPLTATSQLCSGSLGDPVIEITFGNGTGNTGYPPPAAYTYTGSSCPNDGFYTITKSSSGCFGNTWHNISNDHTGGGAFMLVNASVDPGDFFVTSVSSLCANTRYEFSAWIMNVLKVSGIKPNLTFRIETAGGILLQQYNTGDIPESAQPLWLQYGFYFTTPPDNPTIVLRISNNAPGGIGNDLALDDIRFRPCGPTVSAVINGAGDSTALCAGEPDSFLLSGSTGPGFQDPVYQWQVRLNAGPWTDIPAAQGSSYQRLPTVAGAYQYRFTVTERGSVGNPSCRINSGPLTIRVNALPGANAGPDRNLVAGDSLRIQASTADPMASVSWSPADGLSAVNSLTPFASPPVSRQYQLTATSAEGCTDTDIMNITVVAGIFVPSAFTPNNDGRNDRWTIPYLDPSFGATVSVFKRNGQMVYRVRGSTVSWDGRHNGLEQPAGVYVYLIRFPENGKSLSGTVTLIR